VNMSTVNVSPVDEPPAAGVPGTPVGDGRGSRSLERLRSRLGDDVYTSWFRRMMQFETLDGTVLRVSFPTRFLKRWIEMHYAGDLLECCREEFAGVERIEVTVRQQPRPRPETAPSGTVRRQLA